MVSSVEVKTPVAPVYEIKVCNNFIFFETKQKLLFSFINVSYFKLETTAEIPRVNNRWNNEQLLQQALQLILNGQVEYGYVNKAREIIKLKSTMIKSQGNLLKGNYNKTVMPCPFTGPKMIWAGPIFLCQNKNLFTYCVSHKHFVPEQKMICIQ